MYSWVLSSSERGPIPVLDHRNAEKDTSSMLLRETYVNVLMGKARSVMNSEVTKRRRPSKRSSSSAAKWRRS